MSGRQDDDYDDYDDHHHDHGGDVVEDYSEYNDGEVDDAGWGGGGGGSQVQSNQSFEMADYSQRGFSTQSGASHDDGGGYSQAGQSYDDDGYGDGGYDDGGYDDGGYSQTGGGQSQYDDDDGYDDHYDDRQPQGGGEQSGRSFDDNGTYDDEYNDGGGGAQQSGRSFDDGTYETGYNDGGEYGDGGDQYDGGGNGAGGAERSGRSYDVNDAYEEGQEYEAEYNDVQQPQGQQAGDYDDDDHGDEYEVDYSAQGGGGGEAGEEYEADYNDAGHYDDHDDHDDQGAAAVDGGVAVGAVQKEWRNDDHSHVYDDHEDNYDDHRDDVGYDDDEYEDNAAADDEDHIDNSGHSDGGVEAAAAALATHAAHVSATSLGSGYGDTMENDRQQAQPPAHDDDPYEDSLAASSRGPERTPEGLADPNALEADGGELLRMQKEKNERAMAEMEEEEEVFQPAYDDDEKSREEERNNNGAGGAVVMSPKTEASVQSLQYDDDGHDDLDDEKHELAEKGENNGAYNDDYDIADDESFGATKKKRGKCHGKMCGPCPLLFCVQCLGCLLLVAGIVVMIVLGVTGSTFDHTISEVQEALGLTDDETKAPTLRPVAPTTMAPTSAPVITDAPTASPTPVPTSTPTAGPTTTPPVEIATGGPERIYTAPNCTKKKALYYLDLHALGGGNEANEGGVGASTISGTFTIRGAGQKAPLLYEAQVSSGKFSSTEGPWMCLDKRKCHNVEVGLVDEETGESQTEMGWALRPSKETLAATEGGAVATDDATTASVRAAEPNADERPVASGLIPPAGAAGGDGACGFASPPLTARFAKQCPTTCSEGEYSNADKYGPIPAFPSGNGGGNGGGNGKKNDRDKPARGRLFTKNGGCKNGAFLHELVFVGGKDLASASPSGLAVTITQENGELVRVPFDDKNLNPPKSKERTGDDTQYLCLRRNKCYSAEIVPEDEGASVPVVAKRSDLEGAAGWEVRRVLTGNTKKKAGKYGKTLASGSLFGTLEEGSFGNGGGSALEGCDFALQPKKGGAQNAAAAPQCEKSTCGLPVADNIFDSSIAN